MGIDTSGKWWVGSRPGDIRAFLEAYTRDAYFSDVFRLSRCACDSSAFYLEADDDEGAAKRTCTRCEAEHFICDSEAYWKEARPEKWACVECGSLICNIGVGFSLYADKAAIRWLYIGVRCTECGVLGCFAGWKIGYEPSLQLMDKV